MSIASQVTALATRIGQEVKAAKSRANHTGSPTAAWSNGSQKITDVAAGTTSTDAINKGQLDAATTATARMSAWITANVSWASGSPDRIVWNGFGTGSQAAQNITWNAANKEFAVAVAGTYTVDANMLAAFNGNAFAWIALNGTNTNRVQVNSAGGSFSNARVSDTIYCAAGDKIAILFQQSTGASQVIGGNFRDTNVQIVRVSA